MATAQQLILALASLRDSLARISTRADNEDNAMRATSLRLKCNQRRTKAALREIAGDLPDVPEGLVFDIFQSSGLVSAVNPDDDNPVAMALDAADNVLKDCGTFLELRTV